MNKNLSKNLSSPLLFILSLSILIFGCNKDSPVGNEQLMPANLNFVLVNANEGNSPLLSSTSVVKMWYVLDGKNISIDDIKVIPGYSSINDKYKFYATSLTAPLISAEKNVKTFYVEFAGKTGTLSLNVQRIANATERYPYKEVKYNDDVVNLKSDLPSLYVFKH